MIYTVTFNPSLDYIVSMDGFEMGRTNRTTGEQMFPGGKGINVSIVLGNLGIENTALGFTAGFTGEQIEREVQRMGLLTDFIRIDRGLSRINVKLKDYDGTEINGMGPEIGQAHVNALYQNGLRRMMSWCWRAVSRKVCRIPFTAIFWHGCKQKASCSSWMPQRICC